MFNKINHMHKRKFADNFSLPMLHKNLPNNLKVKRIQSCTTTMFIFSSIGFKKSFEDILDPGIYTCHFMASNINTSVCFSAETIRVSYLGQLLTGISTDYIFNNCCKE